MSGSDGVRRILSFLAAGLLLLGAAGVSQEKAGAGLKEALRIGAENAVKLVGRKDGYFGNAAIKIGMPKKLQPLEKGLRAIGQGQKVDEFVLGMNRSAERAAPAAKRILWDAVSRMTIDDARGILGGGETAATDYFEAKTTDPLSAAFRPIVSKAMNEVGVTRQYKELVAQYQAVPFAKSPALDVDQYVVGKALDGLFYMVAEEERKIRKNPAARVSSLLREVFAR